MRLHAYQAYQWIDRKTLDLNFQTLVLMLNISRLCKSQYPIKKP